MTEITDLAATLFANHEEFVVVTRGDDGKIRVNGDDGELLAVVVETAADDAEKIVDAFKALRVAARLSTTKLVECSICSCYHPTFFNGDCREDGNRFPVPDDSDDEAPYFDGYDSRRHGWDERDPDKPLADYYPEK